MPRNISASGLAGFFSECTSKLDRNIKMLNYINRKKSMPFRLQILYFPHGNINEDYAMELLKPYIDLKGYRRELKEGEAFNTLETEYVKRMNSNQRKFEKAEGVGSEVYNFDTIDFQINARPDGITDTHVIELKCPVGGLYLENNLPKIPRQYKLQMIVEMLCHKRSNAYFLQYYTPIGWYSLVQYMTEQYNSDKIEAGSIVYKPFISPGEHVVNIINKVEKKVANFRSYYEDIVGDIEIKGNKAVIDELYMDKIMNLIRLTDDESLKPYFNKAERETIMQTLSFGKDFKYGEVISHDGDYIKIKWQGRKNRNNVVLDNNTESIPIPRFKRGYITIIKDIMQTVKKDKDIDILNWSRNLSPTPTLAKLPNPPDSEYAIIEMNLPLGSKEKIRNFLLTLNKRSVKADSKTSKEFQELSDFLDAIEPRVIAKKTIKELNPSAPILINTPEINISEINAPDLTTLYKRERELIVWESELNERERLFNAREDLIGKECELDRRKREIDEEEVEYDEKLEELENENDGLKKQIDDVRVLKHKYDERLRIIERNKKQLQSKWDDVKKIEKEYEEKLKQLEERKRKRQRRDDWFHTKSMDQNNKMAALRL